MTTKTDMERVGLFKELGYHTINDPYRSSNTVQFNKSASTGKQLLPGGEKTRSATAAGYFNDFSRIYNGEAYTDIPKMRRRQRIAANKQKLGKEWVPASGNKEPSGTGSYYGTISGPISYFQAISKPQKENRIKGKNFYTNPGKRGTGYGYLGLTLGSYPDYKGDKFEVTKAETRKESETHKSQLRGRSVFRLGMAGQGYFDHNPFQGPRDKYKPPLDRSRSAGTNVGPNAGKIFRPSNPSKYDGGMKAGTLNPFPTYSSEPYKPNKRSGGSEKHFIPSAGPKSMPSNSVMNQNIVRTITPMNYRSVQSVMSY